MINSHVQGYVITGCPPPKKKTGTLCFERLNIVRYWPISDLFHCQNQEKFFL